MTATRRDLLKFAGTLAVAAVGGGAARCARAAGVGGHGAALGPDVKGVLVDLTDCVGCRLCEYACKKANGIEPGALESYDDMSVFKHARRPGPAAFTVVNAWPGAAPASTAAATAATAPTGAVYAKVNCLHCNHPACTSACIVGALRKQPSGAVTYDAWKCIGCRYCMVACPFQIPAYEYDNALTPRVRKCELCQQRTTQGLRPACVQECPRQALTYGRRSDLLARAHRKMTERPGRYVNHIYGEHEVGGTSWLYLSGVPFEQVGLATMGSEAPPELTESIQHGVFSPKLGLPPLLLYGALGGIMWLTGRQAAQRRAGGHGGDGRGAISGVGDEGPGGPAARGAGPSGDGAAGGRAGYRGEVERGGVATLVAPRPSPAHAAPHDGAHEEAPAPVRAKLITPGVLVLVALSLMGLIAMGYRFLFGIGASTNLDQQHPWGIWIAIDVASGVVTAAGGFTSAFLISILRREKYEVLARPALLTAMLGYTFVCIGLQADLGRYYNVWHPMIMWNGNSVLFEVGMCVMVYLHVLYAEFAPILLTGVMNKKARFPRLSGLATRLHDQLERIMFVFIIAGCVLSCLHQSSLGNLLVIAPYKLHPLWWTPLSPLLFLLSAFLIGFPMIIFESLLASWSLKQKPEMHVLGDLARFVPLTAGVYLAVKIGDMVFRGTYRHLYSGELEGGMWLIEVGLGVALPALLLCFPRIRRSPRWLFAAALAIVLGVILNRVNVFVIGYHPPFATKRYLPSLCEIGVTVGLVAMLMLLYRAIVMYFPVISQPKARAA